MGERLDGVIELLEPAKQYEGKSLEDILLDAVGELNLLINEV